jgi:pyrimidine-nucleoside phosphorylase
MAIFFKGMSFDEATALTLEMVDSGETIDLSSIPGVKVDKHSTGGVGDKTSLVLLPLVAAIGIPTAKMSGRGLGHTGGTTDKLESIPGFSTAISREGFLRQAREIGIVLAGQTANLVPADKKLYALRDVTATIESIPLIASSIVSKKLASGADAVVLDVKYGDGAFMQDYQEAHHLARMMVEIGNRSGRRFKAVLSDMNQPLGQTIGNSLEVMEAIETLRGEGPADLTELCVTIGGLMAHLAGLAGSVEEGERMINGVITNGAGLEKLKQLIEAQGGDPRVIDDCALLPSAPVVLPVFAREAGWIATVSCREMGNIAMELGAGRVKLDDRIHPEVGLKIHAKVGEYIQSGGLLAEIYARTAEDAQAVADRVLQAFTQTASAVPKLPLIKEII